MSSLDAWARQHLSADRQAQAQESIAAAQAAANAGSGKYTQYSDRSYGIGPEPVVPVRTPYSQYSDFIVGPGGVGSRVEEYGRAPYYATLADGRGWMALGTESEMSILDQAAFAFSGYSAESFAGSRLSIYPQVWRFAVEQSATGLMRGVYKDPLEILAEIARGGYKSFQLTDGSSGPGGGGGGGGGGTTTVTTTNITNPQAAKRLVNQAMSSYLGREATAQEIKQFAKALNAEERQNPTVQTISVDGSGQSQLVEGGMDAAQFTQEYAESRPDYAEYRAATDLMQSFLGILQGPVR